MLTGKRIVLAGLKNRQREIFAQNLAHLCSQNAVALEITENVDEIREGDYVILFGQMAEENTGTAYMGQLSEMLSQMSALAGKKTGSTVLVSDCLVYGKLFGKTDRCREDELGYLSHTKQEELAVYYMRLLEHLACRLAREEGFPVKIVRQDGPMEEQDPAAVLHAVFTVLLSGENGAIYNLPSRNQIQKEETSPLTPAGIIPDTAKIEKLIASAKSR